MVIDCPRAAHVRAAPESPGAGRRTARRRTGARVGRGPFENIGAPPVRRRVFRRPTPGDSGAARTCAAGGQSVAITKLLLPFRNF